ncbi:MAG: hypothetical protein PHW04_13900 [Candidatus Wallbacteria bacterium]|nr:hypothetical protein [Candidatus Wallbacteria bacterium]
MKLPLILLLFCFCLDCIATTRYEAVLTLKKLQERTRDGLRYQEFVELWKDTDCRVGGYLDRMEEGREDRTTLSMQRVMNHYGFAKMVWDYKFAGPEFKDFIVAESALGCKILEKYPEIKKETSAGEVIDWIPNTRVAGIRIEAAVGVIFMKASMELSELFRMMHGEHDESEFVHQTTGYPKDRGR